MTQEADGPLLSCRAESERAGGVQAQVALRQESPKAKPCSHFMGGAGLIRMYVTCS